MDIKTSTPDRNFMLRKHLRNRTHELTFRVNLQQFGLPERPPSIDSTKGVSSFFSLFYG